MQLFAEGEILNDFFLQSFSLFQLVNTPLLLVNELSQPHLLCMSESHNSSLELKVASGDAVLLLLNLHVLLLKLLIELLLSQLRLLESRS